MAYPRSRTTERGRGASNRRAWGCAFAPHRILRHFVVMQSCAPPKIFVSSSFEHAPFLLALMSSPQIPGGHLFGLGKKKWCGEKMAFQKPANFRRRFLTKKCAEFLNCQNFTPQIFPGPAALKYDFDRGKRTCQIFRSPPQKN